MTDPWCCYINGIIWSHGSHPYTPVMLAYIPATWILIMGYGFNYQEHGFNHNKQIGIYIWIHPWISCKSSGFTLW